MKIEIEIPDRLVRWFKYGIIIVACIVIGVVVMSRCSNDSRRAEREERRAEKELIKETRRAEKKLAKELKRAGINSEEAMANPEFLPTDIELVGDEESAVEDAMLDYSEVEVIEADYEEHVEEHKLTRKERREQRRLERELRREERRAEKMRRRAERSGVEIVEVAEEEPVRMRFGIEEDPYRIVESEVESGQTLSHLLDGYGVTPFMVDRIATTAKPTFDFRTMRQGNTYTVFLEPDTLGSEKLRHFVYEKSVTDFVVVTIEGDSVLVREGQKEVSTNRRQVSATITSSLWNAMMEHDLPAALSMEMEDIFGWSVDFFALSEGDDFTVIYDERFIDTVRVGVGQVWGAIFKHNGKEYYAIPFDQDGKVSFWDENGNSLRKQLLKAPLKFTRISSRFSNARLHPIYKVYRPHHGVDYAAPAGTPVVAIADGTVIRRGWDNGGGGNYIRIRHANNLESAYLHLRGFASGISVGTHVEQGQLIGYVGSTGASTGPHLDFRLYKGGTAIDPLKAPSEPVEPISAANKPAFEAIRDRVLAELSGPVADSVRITHADLYGEAQPSVGEP